MESERPTLEYVPLDYLPKEIEQGINAALMMLQSGQVTVCCYQISEALAKVFREMGFDENARAVGCDVYGWNQDLVRFAGGMPIEAPKLTPAQKAKAKRHPQRKGRFKGKKSKKDEKKRRPDLEPYYFGIFHEQIAEGNGYDGHVVVEVNGLIVDCTSMQFNREHRGVLSAPFIVFPYEMCGELDPQYHDLVMRPRSTKEREHPDHMKDLFADGSLKASQILVSSPKMLRKQGQMAYCIRPDIDSDRWLNHTDTARTNIEWTYEKMMKLVEAFQKNPDAPEGSITI